MQTEYKIRVIEDEDSNWDISFYVFADNLDDAKEHVLEEYPNGKIISAEPA
jgi:hypothetical protein